uniref:Uncharacterized protein n=1 Tax=Aegilops tauschii subsp. strangulata TaxID=200361 RepID=A0A453F8M5_AEGTS
PAAAVAARPRTRRACSWCNHASAVALASRAHGRCSASSSHPARSTAHGLSRSLATLSRGLGFGLGIAFVDGAAPVDSGGSSPSPSSPPHAAPLPAGHAAGRQQRLPPSLPAAAGPAARSSAADGSIGRGCRNSFILGAASPPPLSGRGGVLLPQHNIAAATVSSALSLYLPSSVPYRKIIFLPCIILVIWTDLCFGGHQFGASPVHVLQ